MNQKQIELADRLLKLLSEHEGTLDSDQLYYFFGDDDDNNWWFELSSVRDNLMGWVIEWWGNEHYRIKLKEPEGWQAAAIGLIAYKKLEEEKNPPIIDNSQKISIVGNNNESILNQSSSSKSFNEIDEMQKATKNKIPQKIIEVVIITIFGTVVAGLILHFVFHIG